MLGVAVRVWKIRTLLVGDARSGGLLVGNSHLGSGGPVRGNSHLRSGGPSVGNSHPPVVSGRSGGLHVENSHPCLGHRFVVVV
jgi:hypothetical protein